LQSVQKIYRIVGISCMGHEEQFMALLIVIEECHHLEDLTSLSKLGNIGNMELRRLECSINYDAKGESSSRGKGKDKGLSGFFFFYEA